MKQTEELAVPGDECTDESVLKVGDEKAATIKSGAYCDAVKKDADDALEDEEAKSSGSEEFLEARQETCEEIAGMLVVCLLKLY